MLAGSRPVPMSAPFEIRTPAEFRAKAAEHACAAQADWGPLWHDAGTWDPSQPLKDISLLKTVDRSGKELLERVGDEAADPIRGTVRGPHGMSHVPRRGMAA